MRAPPASYPEDRETQDQQDQEDHDEDIEQEAGDVGRCGRYAGEAEDTGDDRHQKEDQRPFQNCHRPSLQPAGRRIRGSYKKIADLTSSVGASSTTDEAGGGEIAPPPPREFGLSRPKLALLETAPRPQNPPKQPRRGGRPTTLYPPG